MDESLGLIVAAACALSAVISYFVGSRVQQTYTEKLLEKHSSLLNQHAESLQKVTAILVEMQRINDKIHTRMEKHDDETGKEHAKIATLLESLIIQIGANK